MLLFVAIEIIYTLRRMVVILLYTTGAGGYLLLSRLKDIRLIKNFVDLVIFVVKNISISMTI